MTMTPTTTLVPTNAPQLYREHRRSGESHDAAIRAAMHAFSRPRHEVEQQCVSARERFEAHPEPVAAVGVEPEQVAEMSEFELARVAAREKIAELTGKRAALSLDVLRGSAKASDLQAVETKLAEAGAEYERADEAQREAARRDELARGAAEGDQQAAARADAAVLAEKAAAQWEAVEACAQQLADALRQHARVALLQSQRLAEAGVPGAERCRQGAGAVRGVVIGSLLAVGVPADWIGAS
jgi:hypothetical protein